MIANMWQLHAEIGSWVSDEALVGTNVPDWTRTNIKLLYLLAILSGSSFSCITLVNSGLFRLNKFSMGLAKYHKSKFQQKRFYSVVLCEVMSITILFL